MTLTLPFPDRPVGIQINQPVGRIMVRRGIETYGGSGDCLVKGVAVRLSAIALSVKPGGSARPVEISGAIETLHITGACAPAGAGFDGI